MLQAGLARRFPPAHTAVPLADEGLRPHMGAPRAFSTGPEERVLRPIERSVLDAFALSYSWSRGRLGGDVGTESAAGLLSSDVPR